MNPFVELLKKPDFREWAAKPFSTMGYLNLTKSLLKANKLNKGPRKNLPRYLLPELWKGLGDRKAVVSSTGAISFEQLADRGLRLSNRFYHEGLSSKDRVAILSSNEQAWFDVMTACLISGIKMPLLNTHLKADELAKCINNCAPKILVFSFEFLEKIQSIEAQLTNVEKLVCSCTKAEAKKIPAYYLRLDTFIEQGKPYLEKGGFGLPQMAFSGGSTGVPKFIVDDERALGTNTRKKGLSAEGLKVLQAKLVYGVAIIGMGRVKGQIVSLIPGPLYHAGVQTAVFPIFFGATIVPMLKYDAEKFLQLIEQEKVNYSFVAPTMLERILKLPEEIRSKYDLSSMQVLLCAAAPCADYVKKEINALFKQQGAKVNVFNEYYGSSEAAIITVLRPEDYEENPERYKSVGKVSGSECKIYNVDEGRECARGEDGHVLARNYRMYSISYGNSDEMDDSFIELDGAYWFDDGCIGHLDADEFLYLTSRSKDMIISGGVNVFPVEIEEVIKSHENILDAAVIKVADADLGEVAGALIQTVDGNDISHQEIIDYCKNNGLYGFKLPKHIKFTDALPKNSAGKIRKKDLEPEFIGSKPIAVASAS